MNKQILKIEETIDWLEKNSPDDASIIIMAMSDLPQDSETPIIEKRNVELKTFIQGYDEDISYMLVQKMINIDRKSVV